MAADVLLVVSTFPDAETAGRIANELVTASLAACANILPPVRSIYRWHGKVEDANELLVFFKTSASRYPDFVARLKELHPYEVPEIIGLPVEQGLPEYLRWVNESCA
jgi:periplasmic divalent cation tolerance protein